jgi:hypothetical protein
MDLLRVVMVGASGTPYHDGLFFFDLQLPPSYPAEPPQVFYHSLPEILPMPCAYDTRRNCKSARQNFHREFAHGKQHTATNATANILCRVLFRKRTAKYLPCAALARTAE